MLMSNLLAWSLNRLWGPEALLRQKPTTCFKLPDRKVGNLKIMIWFLMILPEIMLSLCQPVSSAQPHIKLEAMESMSFAALLQRLSGRGAIGVYQLEPLPGGGFAGF